MQMLRFLRDVDALVQGTDLATFGAVESEFFEAGSEVEIKSFRKPSPTAADMADIVFPCGGKTILCNEDIELFETPD